MALPRLSRPARTAAVLAVAGLAVAGCSGTPGAAATVDGESITVEEVNQAADDYEAVTGQQVVPAAVAYTLVDAHFLNDVAAEYGLAYSDSQVVDFFTEQAATAGTEVPQDGFSDSFVELGRSLLVSTNLTASENVDAIVADYTLAREDAQVEMNPRYGELVEGQLAPLEREWIATPAQ